MTTDFLPEELGVFRTHGLEIYFREIPDEPEDRTEDGYSLGYPGAPEETQVSRVYYEGVEISGVVEALEAATKLGIFERLEELCSL